MEGSRIKGVQTTLLRRRTPKQRRAVATVSAILDAAARIFSNEGAEGATTNRIAERAGVSVGSLYEYFPNKSAILVALTERHLDEGEAVLARAAEDVLAGRVVGLPLIVRRFILAVVDLHAADPDLHRVLFEEIPRPPVIQRRLADLEGEMVASIVAVLASQTELNDVAVRQRALTAVRVVDALVHRWVIDDRANAASAAALIDDLVGLILSYLRWK